MSHSQPGARRPRVTVAVPVYNGEQYLEHAVGALQAQTYSDLEILIGDNASTDGTQRIGEALAARDPRVRYVRHPRNLGVAGNYTRLLELSSSELFRWNDADDWCGPTTIERCVQALDADPAIVLAYPKTYLVDEAGAVREEYDDNVDLPDSRPSVRFRQLFDRMRLCNPLYGVIRSAVLRRTAGLGSYVGSDIVLLAELSLHGGFRELEERLFYRRFHSKASSALTLPDLMRYYNPQTRNTSDARESRHLFELWRAVMRAPIAGSEKRRVYAQLLQRARWNRDVIAKELGRTTWRFLAASLRPSSMKGRAAL